jgi:hypothetical protein
MLSIANNCSATRYLILFKKLFLLLNKEPQILFILQSQYSIPAAPQERVGEARIEPGTAALQAGVTQWT